MASGVQVMLGAGFPHATHTSDNRVPALTVMLSGVANSNGASAEWLRDPCTSQHVRVYVNNRSRLHIYEAHISIENRVSSIYMIYDTSIGSISHTCSRIGISGRANGISALRTLTILQIQQYNRDWSSREAGEGASN